MSVEVDRAARRATILFEIAAHADLYEADCAPRTSKARLADIHAQLLHVEFMENLSTGSGSSRLEVAGRLLAWIEADAADAQQS
jgi:hypothetical protein